MPQSRRRTSSNSNGNSDTLATPAVLVLRDSDTDIRVQLVNGLDILAAPTLLRKDCQNGGEAGRGR